MEHINHFQTEEVKHFEAVGEEFSYKPLTAEDEMNIDISFCYIEENGQSLFDYRRFNILKLAYNLKSVPYKQEVIKSITGKDSSWEDLDTDDRTKLLLKMNSSVFGEILKKVNEIDSFGLELKKKLQT